MGWTWYHATTDITKTANRKKELDTHWTEETKTTKAEVLKSSMVGTVYYSAIKWTDKEKGTSEVFAMVCKTRTAILEYLNFGYKDMTEDMGPYCYDCPQSILKLLTPTDDQYSNDWRKACQENAERKKALRKAMSGFKEGEKIKTKLWYDEEIILQLSEVNDRLWWVDWSAKLKYSRKRVFEYPFEVVEKG